MDSRRWLGAVDVLDDDIAQVYLWLEDRQLASDEEVTLLHYSLMVELANHCRVFVLARSVEYDCRGHRRVHVEVVKDLTVTCRVNPRKVECRLGSLGLLTDAFQPCYPLALVLFFVVDLTRVIHGLYLLLIWPALRR